MVFTSFSSISGYFQYLILGWPTMLLSPSFVHLYTCTCTCFHHPLSTDDAIRSTKMEVESTATRSPVPTSVSDQTPVSTKEPEPPTHFFLPIPEVAFYVGICAVAVVIVVLIVAVTLCCICTCGKRKTQWQPAVQPARTQVTNPSAIALRERERNDRGATITTRATLSPVESFELPSKSGADKMEAYDDPTETVETFCTESDSLPPPPKYEELEF